MYAGVSIYTRTDYVFLNVVKYEYEDKNFHWDVF